MPDVQSYEELLAVLPEPTRLRVEAGELLVFPGKNPQKPVLRDAATGALAKGTGHAPGAGEIGVIGPKYAFKRKKTYREALETLVPSDDDPKIRGSIGWIIKQLEDGIEGGMATKVAVCPECDHKFTVEMYKKVDTIAAIKLLELVHGRAKETQDINLNAQHLHAVLEQRTPSREITVHAVDPKESQRRRDAIDD